MYQPDFQAVQHIGPVIVPGNKLVEILLLGMPQPLYDTLIR